jgi:hypothetical protein
LLSTVAVKPGAMITDTGADLPLRRQDSNLDHRNQNPRCCRYTTADRLSMVPCGSRPPASAPPVGTAGVQETCAATVTPAEIVAMDMTCRSCECREGPGTPEHWSTSRRPHATVAGRGGRSRRRNCRPCVEHSCAC